MSTARSEKLQVSDSLRQEPTGRLSVLHLTLSIGETSAAYNELALGCRDRYQVTVATLFRSTMKPPEDIRYHEGDDSIVGFLRLIKAVLSNEKFDIVHIHAPHVGVLYLISTALVRQCVLPPSVYTVHNSIGNYRKIRTRLLLIPNLFCARKIVCCGEASYASVVGVYRRLAGDRLTYVQNGVDLARVDSISSAETPKQDGEFVVVSVGRLIDIKNPLMVLTACEAAFSNGCRLMFVGTGPLESEIQRRVRGGREESKIEVTGLMSRLQVFRLLRGASLFVSASYGEGLPIATLEAMASRCPVVLSDIPPHREIVGSADFVPLVRPDDMEGFAREIARFREMDEVERRTIGNLCRALVEQRFNLKKMQDGYDKVYRDVIS